MLLDPLQTRQLFQDALENHYAILAVNADSPAAITDCLEAALAGDAPIIVETSLWQLTGHSFGVGDAILGMARYLADLSVLANSERYRAVPVVYHTDHIKGPETREILSAAIRGVPVQFGTTSLMLFASSLSLDSSEMTEEENILFAGELCAIAQSAGRPLTLEIEAGVDDGLTPKTVTSAILSQMEERYPGYVALWAPGLGTRHGFSTEGYPAFSAENVMRQRDWAEQVAGRPVGIALHGSSGLSESLLAEGVHAGIVKVNWSTESLRVRSQVALSFYLENGERLDPKHPQFKVTAMDNGVQLFISERYIPVVRDRIQLLGGKGQASRFLARLS
jgi:fructose/tagatose bisphosphate aldolase